MSQIAEGVYEYEAGIYGIDSHYEADGRAAVYLVVDSGRVAMIDTAHNGAVKPVLEAMKKLGLSPDLVDYICLTHVHLDHAGGAGTFMRTFENAKLVVHARGARHMAAPDQLMEGVRAVYGAEETQRLYGELVPVSAERIVTPEDGQCLKLGGRRIVCLDTPGHARHHLAYFDETAGAVFSGDIFGMSYPELDRLDEGGRQGVIPTTSPVQFDPEGMIASMDRILALHPGRLFPTHFGEVRNPSQIAEDLKRQIGEYVRVAEESRGDIDRIRGGLTKVFEEEARAQSWPQPWHNVREFFAREIEMNAQGLKVWYVNKSKKRS